MRVLNDYLCDHCGRMDEHFVENHIKTVECLDCGNVATKVRSVPNFQLPGNDPAGFPTAADKWVKKREQKMAQELKSENT
jgi:Zn ribbon nucleic-acid-binding protein